MHDFFLNAYMMYVWRIFFFLWENAFMKFWTFSFWKCIYECMIFFNAYIVHVWKIFSKKNAFMNAWFLFECIYKWNFWECIYDVRNSRRVYKRFCECMRRYSQADFVPLKIHAWKSIFYFLSNFPFFLIITHEWMLEIVISKFFNDMHECLLYIVFFFYFFSMIIYAQMYYFFKKKYA